MAPVQEPATDDWVARLEKPNAELATQADRPDLFFSRFLAKLQEAVPFRLATVWGLNEQGVLEKIAELGGGDPLPKDAARVRQSIHQVLSVLSAGASQVHPLPQEGASDLATLITPLIRQGRPIGAIEVVVDEVGDDGAATREQLSVVESLAHNASAYIHQIAPPLNTPPETDSLAAVALQLHQTLSVEQVALTAANEGRRLVGCDRLSIAVQNRGKTEMKAVSGRNRVAGRAESVKGLRAIAELVVASRCGCKFEGGSPVAPSPIDQALSEHAAQSGARRIEAVPLIMPPPLESDSSQDPEQEPCGVMLVEQFTGASPQIDDRVKASFAKHVAVALANAQRHERLAGSLPGRLLGKFYSPTQKRQSRRAMAWLGTGILALVLLGLVPTTYRVESRGELLPAVRSFVFAPSDGEVVEILVEGGEQVDKGDMLLRLTNERLSTDLLSLRNRLRDRQQSLAMLQAEVDQQPSSADDTASIRIQGRISKTKIEIEGLHTRLEELERERSRLDIRATHAGYVATFQPEQMLRQRPVRRGEMLLEVMDFDGQWELRLDCPADKLGHLTTASASANSPKLPVEFVLSTQPERTFTGTVVRQSNRAISRAAGVRVVEIIVAVESTSLSERQASLAGSEVIARIDCGRKPLAYVLFGSLYDAQQRWFW